MPSETAPAFLSSRIGRTYDLCTVGTALVDYLSFAPEQVVLDLALEPGAMTLVDGKRAGEIRAALGEGRDVVSGGTVANTAAGVASLGGHPVFVGAVARDDLGQRYELDLEAIGVRPVLEQLPVLEDQVTGTGTCYVIVTPDRQRTMATTLGVSGLLGHETITESVISSSSLVYFDGYLLDFPDAQGIVNRILELAKNADTHVALGLADPFVVERHGERLRTLAGRVDLVFSNEDEATALTGTKDAEAAMSALLGGAQAAVVTRGPSGALIGSNGAHVHVEAAPVLELVDTTGAGDLFAAGVCFAATHGLSAELAGRLGALCAAEAIGHLGARPATPLAGLAEIAGLL